MILLCRIFPKYHFNARVDPSSPFLPLRPLGRWVYTEASSLSWGCKTLIPSVFRSRKGMRLKAQSGNWAFLYPKSRAMIKEAFYKRKGLDFDFRTFAPPTKGGDLALEGHFRCFRKGKSGGITRAFIRGIILWTKGNEPSSLL